MDDKQKAKIKRYKQLCREYKKCAAGKPINCDKCIGCASKR